MKYFLPLLLLVSICWAQNKTEPDGDEMVFIVNSGNASAELTANEVRDYYFKRKRVWPSGESVRFIDRSITSHIHDVFVRTILRKSNSEVELFWIGQKLYTGDSAPLRETSDSSTIQFVSSFKGAIGYISSASAITDQNVKVLKVTGLKKEE